MEDRAAPSLIARSGRLHHRFEYDPIDVIVLHKVSGDAAQLYFVIVVCNQQASELRHTRGLAAEV